VTAHHTISAKTINLVAERAGVAVLDVRRALLGLRVDGAAKILAELRAAGVEVSWLRELSAAAQPLNPYVPGAGATDINAERTPRQ
jgi:hypothetical protein